MPLTVSTPSNHSFCIAPVQPSTCCAKPWSMSRKRSNGYAGATQLPMRFCVKPPTVGGGCEIHDELQTPFERISVSMYCVLVDAALHGQYWFCGTTLDAASGSFVMQTLGSI